MDEGEPDAEAAESESKDITEEAELVKEAEEKVVEDEEEEEEEEVEQEADEKKVEEVVQLESEVAVNETSEAVSEQVIDMGVSFAEKDELEKASVVAQADETEQMEELVAGLGDGESDIGGSDDASMQEAAGEMGSGDTGEAKLTEEAPCQAAVQDVVEVPDGEVEESEVNTTGIEIAQEVVEVSEDSGDAVTNDLELNDITPIQIDEGSSSLSTPIQIDEGSSSLSNGEQPSLKRKHDEEHEEDYQSSKKARVFEDLENIQEPYTNGDGSAESEDITKDYVVIEMGDVPPSESQEVVESVPKETVQNFTSEEGVINEPQTVEQTETQSESNPVYNRVFMPNPNFGGAADTSKQFSIVSYNVLADCHLFRNDYSFTRPDYLEPDYRLDKLMEEIQFLDADIVCLQEVDPDFFQDQLLPHMKG